ncbi:hypothetical protein EYC80_003638 [Monilinia laxa]|uniref:Gfd2/YDR514C-like C-terminal domain-containing protein n=1 Tax=Monilinia laxa TaxID=61186 RepID=A0A5N6KK96_MONLA|nr:hypothetical protein EYC80_003638 [Monilinia laxa]
MKNVLIFSDLESLLERCTSATDALDNVVFYGNLQQDEEYKKDVWADEEHECSISLRLPSSYSVHVAETKAGSSKKEAKERCCASLIEKLRAAAIATEVDLASTTKHSSPIESNFSLDPTAKPFDAGLSNWEQLSSSMNEVSKPNLPLKPYVFIAIDLEATLEQWEYYPKGVRRSPGSGKVYPKQTPTQIGISILRATGKNAELFAKHPKSKAGTQFRSINIVEFQRYRSRIKKLRTADISFLYGNSEYVELDNVSELILKIVAEDSEYGEVILVGHAIQNDKRFLENGNIHGLHKFFDRALDTQFMHREPGTNCRSLQDLVWSYDDNLGDGWHNAGNDAMWTLWVFANKLQDFLTVSESGNEMVIDYSRPHKYVSKRDQWRIDHAARLAELRVLGWD